MIWVNLLQDTLASLSLATELPVDQELLRRQPYGRYQNVVSPIMMRNIIAHGVYQLAILFYMLFAGIDFQLQLGWIQKQMGGDTEGARIRIG